MDISQLRYYTEELKMGGFEIGGATDHVELVTGEKPETFETTVRRYVNKPSLIDHNLIVGNKLSTMIFMMKMLLIRVPDLDKWEVNHGHPLLKNPTLSHESDEWLFTAEKQELNLIKIQAT